MNRTGTWYPPSAGTGGMLTEAQLLINPPFHHTMNNELDSILAERGKRYGAFCDHARITMDLKRVIDQNESGLADDQIEALHMICHKIGRILAGDPNYDDSWVDIAGYAKLVADRLKQAPQPQP